jgi:hypothetical protein
MSDFTTYAAQLDGGTAAGDGGVSRETLTACDLCGDAVAFDDETAPEYVCTCCFGVICPKHTARVTCPHEPAAHDDAAPAGDGRR